MGLDMYLGVRKFFSNYDFGNNTEKRNYQIILAQTGLEDLASEEVPSLSVEVNLMYWRKANHIHKWFVDNCGDGEDNCQKMYVDKTDIEKLINTCKDILDDPSKGEELLPTESGFFFGSTEYDEYYLGQVKETYDRLLHILKHTPFTGSPVSFWYQASW